MNVRFKKEDRKFQVLAHIIGIYVENALPVSSKAVTRSMGESVSSATVRNVMAELEEKGYIEQPHTSAGRVPTDRGYRCYIDSVKERLAMEKREAERLAGEYTNRIESIKDIIEKTSFIISRELRQAGIVMWPAISGFHLKHLEVVKIQAETILAVLITVNNAVQNYTIRITRDLEKAELERVSNFINMNYGDMDISQISDSIKDFIGRDEGDTAADVAKSALEIVDGVIEKDVENDICWEGLDYFTEEPEFMDPGLTRHIFKLFSDRKDLIALMRRELPYGGMRVYIGEENELDILKGCSIVTAGYELYGKPIGRIGVLGPTRMNYVNALRTLSCLSELISSKLESFYG